MNFLDNIFLDNTIRSYLIVLLTIAFVLVIKKVLSRYIASLLYLFVRHNWKTIEKPAFIALIIRPLAWFLTISIAVFAIDKLNFPSAFYFRIYGHASDEILQRIGICLIIVYFFWFFLSLIDFIALIFEQRAKVLVDKADEQLILFFRDFLKVMITILGILLIIKAGFNQKIGTVLTGLSIVGAAMALAAKESLENLIASFVIFFDKPFYTGDSVKVNSVAGTVEHIGLRSTRIRTADKTLITVPNKQMVDSIVDNLSMRTQRRAEIKLDFAVRTEAKDIERLTDAVKKILSADPSSINNFSVFLTDLNKNGISITIELFTGNCTIAEFNEIKQGFILAIKKYMETLKLDLAAPAATDITIIEGNNAALQPNSPII